MARLRLLGTVLYYLAILYAYYSLCLWVSPSLLEGPSGRAGVVFFGVVATPLVVVVSEVDPVELRTRFLDAILGDRRDR